MGLRQYVIRRCVYMFLLIIAIVCFNFFLFRLPAIFFGADPIDLMITDALKQTLNQDLLQQMYANFGLVMNPDVFDWIYMFWRYIVSMFTGNFGVSFSTKQPVMQSIIDRLPNTLLLMGTASIVSILLGMRTGIRAASDPGSKKDIGAITLSLFLYALPFFWIGMILLMFFGYMLPVWTQNTFGVSIGFPQFGTISYEVWDAAKASPFGAIMVAGDILFHLFLPMMTLAIGAFGYWFLYMRNNLVTVLTEDYILTARAKGLDENQVLYKHGLKNAMLPMVTAIALAFSSLITGTVLIETVFSWRGLGRFIFESLIALDYPVVQAIFLIIAVVTIVANFVADMLYGVLDPRIKYG